MVNTTLVTTTLVTPVTTTKSRSVSSKNKDHILNLIKSVSGQVNVIAFPRLFVDITGDPSLAIMLSQLIYWSDRATRADGMVYKTSKDWIEELGVSSYAVRKFKQLPYIKTRVMKANAFPTTHYRLDMNAFIELVMRHLQIETPVDIDEGCDQIDESYDHIDNSHDDIDDSDIPFRQDIPAIPTISPVDSAKSLTETTPGITTEINSQIKALKGETTKKIPPSTFQTDTSIQVLDINPQEPPARDDPPEVPPQNDDFQEFCAALGRITGYDHSIRSNARRLISASRQLIHAGYAVPDLERFLGWWKGHDWRWKKDNQLPSPEDVLTNIARSRARSKDYARSWLDVGRKSGREVNL